MTVPEIGDIVIKTLTPANASANPNSTVATISASIEAGKYYSFFTSGMYDATSKTTTGFVVEDIIPAADTSSAYVRFVNTIPDNINGFDLKAVNTTTLAETVIAPPVNYQKASAFVKVPNGVYNLRAISTNTPSNFTISRNSVSFSKGMVYTISSKGTITVSTGTNAPALDLTRNR